MSDPFVDAIFARIAEEKATLSAVVLRGTIDDLGKYKQLTGMLAAFDKAITIIDEAKKDYLDDKDDELCL